MVTSLLVENYYNSGRVGQNDSDYGALFSQVKLMTVTIFSYVVRVHLSICCTAQCTGVHLTVPVLGLILTGEMNQSGAGGGQEMCGE